MEGDATLVLLDVGGTRYTTLLGTLLKRPDSMLARMFEAVVTRGSIGLPQHPDGAYVIDRDGPSFRFVLNYLRDGGGPVLPSSDVELAQLLAEAHYYMLDDLADQVQRRIRQRLYAGASGDAEQLRVFYEKKSVDASRDCDLVATPKDMDNCMETLSTLGLGSSGLTTASVVTASLAAIEGETERIQRAQEILQKFLWLCPNAGPAMHSSLCVVRALLEVSPAVARTKMLRGGLDCRGLTALHVAVARRFPSDVVGELLRSWPEAAKELTRNDCDQPPKGEYVALVCLAAESNCCSFRSLALTHARAGPAVDGFGRSVGVPSAGRKSAHPFRWHPSSLPLHLACQSQVSWTSDSTLSGNGYECALPVSTRTVEMLLEVHKEAAVRNVVHETAVACCHYLTVSLVDLGAQAVMVPTPTPTLPVRLALEAKASAAAIGMLGSAHPQGRAKFLRTARLPQKS